MQIYTTRGFDWRQEIPRVRRRPPRAASGRGQVIAKSSSLWKKLPPAPARPTIARNHNSSGPLKLKRNSPRGEAGFPPIRMTFKPRPLGAGRLGWWAKPKGLKEAKRTARRSPQAAGAGWFSLKTVRLALGYGHTTELKADTVQLAAASNVTIAQAPRDLVVELARLTHTSNGPKGPPDDGIRRRQARTPHPHEGPPLFLKAARSHRGQVQGEVSPVVSPAARRA